jgi:HD-like signal output (HDOD) protein
MVQSASAKTTNILDLVNQTLDLPTIPTVLVKLNEVINDPEATATQVASVIAADPAVSTNILRIVNSAYYGLQVRVSSVNLAVSIMGFHMTRKVALRAAIFKVFGRKGAGISPHFDPENFWRHSIFTGIAAREMKASCSAFNSLHPEDIYICGLLHDIGKIILLENQPQAFNDILEQSARAGAHTLELEQQVLGFNHADVGSVLGIKWFLPEDLTIAIRYHHSPDRDPFHSSLSSLIHVADTMAWDNGQPSSQNTGRPELSQAALRAIGLTQPDLQEISVKVREEFAANGTPW